MVVVAVAEGEGRGGRRGDAYGAAEWLAGSSSRAFGL